jgi:DNA-binding response OmpR family regulator
VFTVKLENVTVSDNPSSSGGSVRILIVDDNPATRRTTAIGLKVAGFQVDAAGSVGEALDMLRESSYDFIISDIRMPLKTGLDLMEEGQTLCPMAKWIFMSAFDFPVEEVTERHLNPHGFVRKPFRIAEILKLMDLN